MYRSDCPPWRPTNTSLLPSGDQLGEVAPSRSTLMRLTTCFRLTSMMYRASRAPTLAGKAMYCSSGDHEIDVEKNRKDSKSAERSPSTSLEMTSPLMAEAR